MESITSFTSSRGLMKSCKARNSTPVSSSDFIDPLILNGHAPGESIYICTDALLNFSHHFVEQIHHPFTLVTGDSDTPINNNLIQHGAIKKILDHPHLVNWFAQNMVADHTKLHQMPIGMDYHTMWERPGTWGLAQQSPFAQERVLMNTLAGAPDFGDRFFAGYCNWHFAIDRGDRQECLEKIDKSISLIEKNHLPRISSWQRQAECMFVISPEGAGIDCHRTWEAILLGCVPVIRKNKFSALLNHLPVVMLDDWSEFNSAHMIQQVDRLKSEKFNFSPMLLKHWEEKINGKTRFNLPDMSIKEFKNFLCRESF
jgi:hypothetical protein